MTNLGLSESILIIRLVFTKFSYKICHFVILWPVGTQVDIDKN